MRITAADYLMGRDAIYPGECTAEVRANVERTVEAVNELLVQLAHSGVALELNRMGSIINSGWRPAGINAQTKGAAPKSKHMLGLACDLYDPEGAIDDWCMEHPEVLSDLGLYMEHPSATKGWCHVQVVPPGSGKRVFYP